MTAVDLAHELSVALPGPSTRAETFEKGQKRSIEDYKVFKTQNQWPTWHRELLATGNLHNVSNVFNHLYRPGRREYQVEFEAQKRFVFAVFTATLKETSAAELLRQHSVPGTPDYGNAQLLYRKLHLLFQEGVNAQLEMERLETEMSNLNLDHTWTKKVETFVNAIAAAKLLLPALFGFECIPALFNTADILTKNLPAYQAKDHTEPLLFWKGETDVL